MIVDPKTIIYSNTKHTADKPWVFISNIFVFFEKIRNRKLHNVSIYARQDLFQSRAQ